MFAWIVYELSIDGHPFYIGITNNLKRRTKEHRRRLGRRVRFDIRILEQGSDPADRYLAEHRWIEKYRTEGYALGNLTEGGEGHQTLSAQAREKLSQFNKGRSKPSGFGEKLSRATKGKPHNWTVDGMAKNVSTRFKVGSSAWDKLTPEQKVEHTERSRQSWDSISPEERSRMARERNLAAWAKRTPEQRAEIAQKIADTKAKKNDREARSEACRARMLANPPDPKIMSNAIRNFWASMSPEQRADYLARRSESIRKGWAAKRAKKAETQDITT